MESMFYKKKLMAKKANGFNIANGCAAMGATGATGPLIPSVHGNRHVDVAARRRQTSGCSTVVGKSKFQSAGKRGIGGRLDGVAKMCFNIILCMSDLKSKRLRKIAYS